MGDQNSANNLALINSLQENSLVLMLKEMMMNTSTSLIFLTNFSVQLMPFPQMRMRNFLSFKTKIVIMQRYVKLLLQNKMQTTIWKFHYKNKIQEASAKVQKRPNKSSICLQGSNENLQSRRNEVKIMRKQVLRGTYFTALLRHCL